MALNHACNCCEGPPANEPLIAIRSVLPTCGSGSCCPPLSYPSLPAWSEDVLYPVNVISYGVIGAAVAANFANEDGCVLSGDPIGSLKGDWKLTLYPSITCYAKVWYRVWTTTFAEPSWDPPITDSTTSADYDFTWTGTENPCIAHPLLSVEDFTNRIYGPTHTESVPSARTLVTVELLKYSFVDGYEPDISDPYNPQPNGYPNPAWEASPP